MIDWKILDDEPRMVLYKHSHSLDHDCVYYFNLQHAPNANLIFHQFGGDAICFVRQYAHDLRISGQLGVPHTEDEKAENTLFYFQHDKSSLKFSKQIDANCRFDQ